MVLTQASARSQSRKLNVDLLAILAPITPNTPLLLRIQAPLLAALSNLTGQPPLIHAMVPLRNLLFELNLLVIKRHARALEEQVERLLRAFPGADEHLHNTCWVDQFLRAHKMRSRS